MTEKVVLKRITDYGPKPRSARAALIQAHALLSEEGTWMQGDMFEDGDPVEAYEKSQCGSWKACLAGAIGLVTGDMPITVRVDGDVEQARLGAWQDAVIDGSTTLGFDEWLKANSGSIDLYGVDAYFNWDEDAFTSRGKVSAKAIHEVSETVLPLGERLHGLEDDLCTVTSFNDKSLTSKK